MLLDFINAGNAVGGRAGCKVVMTMMGTMQCVCTLTSLMIKDLYNQSKGYFLLLILGKVVTAAKTLWGVGCQVFEELLRSCYGEMERRPECNLKRSQSL